MNVNVIALGTNNGDNLLRYRKNDRSPFVQDHKFEEPMQDLSRDATGG